jgi:hypothetical protein
MLVTLLGMVTLVKLLHSSNAASPMLVTLSGIFTLAKWSQLLNAKCPIIVTLSGMATLVKLLHPSNAKSPMPITGKPFIVDGIMTSPALVEHKVYPVIVTVPPDTV